MYKNYEIHHKNTALIFMHKQEKKKEHSQEISRFRIQKMA